jgi:hypothetical protein
MMCSVVVVSVADSYRSVTLVNSENTVIVAQ